MTTDWTTEATGTGTYADLNGLHLYYETHGEPRAGTVPLILLHGGLGSGGMFGPVIPALASSRQVITVDLQGHGRTADIDRPLTPIAMGDDIAALIRHLGLAKVDVLGYSLGGGAALFTALNHPDLVRKVILVSVYTRADAIDPALQVQQAQMSGALADMMKGTPMYETYTRLAPRPEDFPRLLDKLGAFMGDAFDYGDQVRALRVPTMLVSGDADMAPPSHSVEAFALLDGGLRDGGWMGENRPKGGHALAILPGLQHYNIFASPLLAAVAIAFLDAPAG